MPEKSTPHFDILRQFQLFNLLDDGELHELSKLFNEITIPAGQVIVSQNSIVDKHYIICDGNAKVTRTDLTKAGETIDIATITKGYGIGLYDLVFFSETGLRTSTVTSLTPMTLLCIEHPQFFEFTQHHSTLYKSFANLGEKILLMFFLTRLNVLTNLTAEQISSIASLIKKETVGEGTIFFRRGYQANKCYFIISGKVGIYATDDFEKTKTPKAILTNNTIFGEAALFRKGHRNATALAETDCVVFSLNSNDLQQLLKSQLKAQSTIDNLLFKRKKPKVRPHVKLTQEQSIEDDDVYLLKDSSNEKSYQLNDEQLAVWNCIDGTSSIRSIENKLTSSFSGSEAAKKQYLNEIENFILQMEKTGFIILETDTVDEKTRPSSFWKKILAKLGLI